MSHIRFEEAFKLIESGEVISLTYCTYDHKRKTGGKLVKLPEAVITQPKKDRENTDKKEFTSKAQNHYQNATRNFYQCINGQPTASIKKIHIYLILEVNGLKVML